MAIDLATVLGGLGATAMAFADPRQSLLMSQGIMKRNQQIKDRKEREKWQLEQLELQRQKIAMQLAQQRQAQANWVAEQAVREGRLGLQGQKYADERALQAQERAQWASHFGGGATPGVIPAAAPNPFDLSGAAPYSAVSAPTATPASGPTDAAAALQEASATGMPALPQIGMAPRLNTLRSSLLSDPGAPPPGLGAPGQAAASTGDPEQDAFRRWEAEYRRALRTGNKRIIDAVAKMKPSAALVKLDMGEQGPEPESGFSIARDAQGNVIYEDWVDPVTRQAYRRPKQIPAVTKPPGAEETRGLALADSVLTRAGEIEAAVDRISPADRATYFASRTPLLGQFFSDTTGGQLSTKVNDLVQNSTYLVSGAEAPPREVQQRFDTYAPKAWDSPENVKVKLSYITAVARNIQRYRLNTGMTDNEKPVPESAWREAFAEADAALEGRAGFTIPVSPDGIPAGYSFSSYDANTGIYQYQDKDGNTKFWAP